jgi:hypothetical protein
MVKVWFYGCMLKTISTSSAWGIDFLKHQHSTYSTPTPPLPPKLEKRIFGRTNDKKKTVDRLKWYVLAQDRLRYTTGSTALK